MKKRRWKLIKGMKEMEDRIKKMPCTHNNANAMPIPAVNFDEDFGCFPLLQELQEQLNQLMLEDYMEDSSHLTIVKRKNLVKIQNIRMKNWKNSV